MDKGIRLADRLVDKAGNIGPENESWKQFVLDHKKYLRSKCKKVSYVTEDLVRYRYRPIEFIEKHEADANMLWIFMLINDLRNTVEFNETRTSYFVFDRGMIRELYEVYESSAMNPEISS